MAQGSSYADALGLSSSSSAAWSPRIRSRSRSFPSRPRSSPPR